MREQNLKKNIFDFLVSGEEPWLDYIKNQNDR